MDNEETINKKIEYLKNMIADWNLESGTKAVYEQKISQLEAQKSQLNQMTD
jgi:hypothetical protein